MKLEKMVLENFRCFHTKTELIFDELTCLIGKNDIGKSSVLEALDAFFNDKIDAEDLSTNHSSTTIEIRCFFSGIRDQIVLDTSVETSPYEEGILNSNGELEVIRRFNIGKTVSKSVWINGYYPVDQRVSNLLSLKKETLILMAQELGVDLEGIPKNQNPPMRKAIREFVGGERVLKEIKVDGNLSPEDNLKTIWKKLYEYLPIYSLFKVDKTLDDKDKDVQDPMKSAVEESLALPEIRALLEQVEEKVRANSTKVADQIINKLKDLDSSVAEKLKSDFKKEPSWKSVFDLTLLNENNIPLNKRGSGVRRLVLLSFFQAQAEKRKAVNNAPSIIYAIEEPEISQHPDHQLLLINSLIELSQQETIQVIFTSHSSNLVREIPTKSLRYIYLLNEKIEIDYGWDYSKNIENEIAIDEIINALGILPNPADKIQVILYLEGSNDVNALKRYSKILNDSDPDILNLMQNEKVGYVITGGSSLKHYLEQKYLIGLGKPEVHIYDNDKQEYIKYVQEINSENNPKRIGFNTSKLELENYLHNDAIIEAYNDNGQAVNIDKINDTEDVPLKVAEAIYSNSGEWDILVESKKKEKADQKKSFLNKEVAEKMTVERISERDISGDITKWLNTIKNFLN